MKYVCINHHLVDFVCMSYYNSPNAANSNIA